MGEYTGITIIVIGLRPDSPNSSKQLPIGTLRLFLKKMSVVVKCICHEAKCLAAAAPSVRARDHSMSANTDLI
jgi:hypothetical protein